MNNYSRDLNPSGAHNHGARRAVPWWAGVVLGLGIAWAGASLAQSTMMEGLWRFMSGDPISAEEINNN